MRSHRIRKTAFRGKKVDERKRKSKIERGVTFIETFFALAPPVSLSLFSFSLPFHPSSLCLSSLPRTYIRIYIHGTCYSYSYARIFRSDETLPRIIKLAKYFRATAVITQPGSGSFYFLPSVAAPTPLYVSRDDLFPSYSSPPMQNHRLPFAQWTVREIWMHICRALCLCARWTCLLAVLSRTRAGKRSARRLLAEVIGFHGESATL